MSHANGDLASLCGLAVNPAAPPPMLLRLAAFGHHGSAVAHALLAREQLPPAVASDLAGHRDPQVRQSVAAHPSTSDEVRRVLAGDPEPAVRAEVALWPGYWIDLPRPHRVAAAPLPAEVYHGLAADAAPAVRAALGKNRCVPEAVRVVLSGDSDPDVRRCAALHALPTPVLHHLMRDPDRGVRRAALITAAVCAPAATIPLQVAELFQDDAGGFPDMAVELVELTPPLLQRLWALPDLRKPLARNPSFPAERMPALLEDAEVRPALAGNPRLPASLLEPLVAIKDPEVDGELLRRTDLPDRLRRRLIEPDEPLPVVVSLLPRHATLEERLSYLDHPNAAFRRTLALADDLPAHAVTRLAGDPDFSTRLLICERYADVPPASVADVVEGWPGHTREALLRHPRLPADSVSRYVAGDSPGDRAAIARRPDLPAALVLQLEADAVAAVRQAAAANPNLPHDRLHQLLAGPDFQLRKAAASNPALSVEEMERMLV